MPQLFDSAEAGKQPRPHHERRVDEYMSVLVVAHQYWPTPGSATQRLSSLVARLRERSESVDVITTQPPHGIQTITHGPHGEAIHYGAGPERTGTSLRRVARLGEFALGIVRLGSQLSPDVVVTDPPPTAAWAARKVARRQGAGFVYYMCDSWGGATRDADSILARIAHPAVQQLENHLLTSSSHVIASTDGMQRIAEQAGAASITVVRNGIPLDIFVPQGPTWAPSAEARPYFVYAGNAGVVHGAEVFAEAAADLWRLGEQFDLVYIGHGSDMPRLHDHKAAWPDRIHLLPTQPPEMIASAFRGAVGALSSLRPFPSYIDARPIKTITGLACGCPPVYAGDGDFGVLLSTHNLGFVTGWSVEGARESLQKALALRSTDPAAEAHLRNRCAEFAREHFDARIPSTAAADIVSACQRPAPRKRSDSQG